MCSREKSFIGHSSQSILCALVQGFSINKQVFVELLLLERITIFSRFKQPMNFQSIVVESSGWKSHPGKIGQPLGSQHRRVRGVG